MTRDWKARTVALASATWLFAGAGCSPSDPTEEGPVEQVDTTLQEAHEFYLFCRYILNNASDMFDVSDPVCPVREHATDTTRVYRGDCTANGTTFGGFASEVQGADQHTWTLDQWSVQMPDGRGQMLDGTVVETYNPWNITYLGAMTFSTEEARGGTPRDTYSYTDIDWRFEYEEAHETTDSGEGLDLHKYIGTAVSQDFGAFEFDVERLVTPSHDFETGYARFVLDGVVYEVDYSVSQGPRCWDATRDDESFIFCQ